MKDEITIQVKGAKQFRQLIIDLIYKLLMDENIQTEAAKDKNGFDLYSTIQPSEELKP